MFPCDDGPRAVFSEPARRGERGCDGRRRKKNKPNASGKPGKSRNSHYRRSGRPFVIAHSVFTSVARGSLPPHRRNIIQTSKPRARTHLDSARPSVYSGANDLWPPPNYNFVDRSLECVLCMCVWCVNNATRPYIIIF